MERKNRLIFLSIITILSIPFVFGIIYHQPISTGDTSKHVGRDSFDASGVVWYEPESKWLLLLQTVIEIYLENGTYSTSTNQFSCTGVNTDHEGISTINKTSEIIIVQSENGAGVCIMNATTIIDGGDPGVIEDFDWPTTDADCGNGSPSAGGAEGVVFVPDSSLTGLCRYDGFLIGQDQGAGYFYKYCINLTTSTLNCIERIAKPNCNGNAETPALEYDYKERLLYVQSDNGDATCVINPYNFSEGYSQTILDPNTGGGRTDTFEGFAIGRGKIAYADDGTSGTNDAFNGLWLFEDNLTYPTFYNYVNNPINASVYVPLTSYRFNVTINNTNGTAGIEFNSVNYSVSNLSSVFNFTILDLGVGTYSFYWWAFGNGSLRGYDYSTTQYYTIAKASGNVSGTINGTSGNFSVVNGSSNLNVYLNATNITGGGRGQIYLVFFRKKTIVL